MKKIIILFLLFCLNKLQLNSEDILTVYVDAGNPPFMYQENGKAAGIYPDLVYEAFRRMKIPVNIIAAPWIRVLYNGETGQAGIAGIYKNSEREKIYDYSEPIFSETLMIFVKKTDVFKFNSISDLRGKRIGVITSWSYGEEFDNARKNNLFTTDPVERDKLNFLKLEAGRTDCLIAVRENGERILSELGFYRKIIMLDKPVAVNNTFLVFSKAMKKNTILRQFNREITEMKKDGVLKKIIERSFNKKLFE
jgi:polar amino acid transport system substrate-binding protein